MLAAVAALVGVTPVTPADSRVRGQLDAHLTTLEARVAALGRVKNVTYGPWHRSKEDDSFGHFHCQSRDSCTYDQMDGKDMPSMECKTGNNGYRNTDRCISEFKECAAKSYQMPDSSDWLGPRQLALGVCYMNFCPYVQGVNGGATNIECRYLWNDVCHGGGPPNDNIGGGGGENCLCFSWSGTCNSDFSCCDNKGNCGQDQDPNDGGQFRSCKA